MVEEILLFGDSWPNSLGPHGNRVDFRLVGDAVHFGFNALFDANEGDWESGNAEFSRDDFTQCMAELMERGKAEITIGTGSHQTSSLSFTRDQNGVHLNAVCGDQGLRHTFSEIPKSALRLLGVALD